MAGSGNRSRSPINISSSSSEESDEEWSGEENDFIEGHDSTSEFHEEFSSEKNDLDEDKDEDDDRQLDVKRRKTGRCTESAILTDLNLLNCPICNTFLNSPVYQCTNGHIACAPCCTKMRNKCRACRLPIGTIRCRAIEKVIESVKAKCQNTLYGCTQTFHKKNKYDHERTCIYFPCSCPFPKCNYTGLPKPLYKHFGREHPHSKFCFDTVKSISMGASQKKVFLQDSEQSTLFILIRRNKHGENFVCVTCVAHDSQQRGAFSYDLTVVTDKNMRLKIEADVVCMPKKWTRISDKLCLPLHADLVKHSAPLKLELIIRRKRPPVDV